MTYQHGRYTLLKDDSSSIFSSSSDISSLSSSTESKPRILTLRNVAATPPVTSPTRANVLESLVPLSVNNIMPHITFPHKETHSEVSIASSETTATKTKAQ
ncbi:hypothetical protein FBU30_009863 [Linnemannia zychae]|nr:hypothetical protein FBU30_009863 [Linnemannia zychae]